MHSQSRKRHNGKFVSRQQSHKPAAIPCLSAGLRVSPTTYEHSRNPTGTQRYTMASVHAATTVKAATGIAKPRLLPGDRNNLAGFATSARFSLRSKKALIVCVASERPTNAASASAPHLPGVNGGFPNLIPEVKAPHKMFCPMVPLQIPDFWVGNLPKVFLPVYILFTKCILLISKPSPPGPDAFNILGVCS